MMFRSLKIGAVTGVVLLLSMGAWAQRLTGTIKGTVADQTGGVLPGVSVTLTSPSLIGGAQVQVSNERGEFRFPALDPGVYNLKTEMMGFGPLDRQNVRVNVGGTVDLTLELTAKMEAVSTVTAAGPVVDVESTKLGVNFTSEMIKNIPNNRSLDAIFNFAPGVVGGAANGSSVRGNNLSYDGVNITDPTVGTAFVFFNYGNFEEVQVQTGGHPAEYGQGGGAVVNVVTKSGGNSFSGEGNVYYQNGALSGTNGQDITAVYPNLTPAELHHKIDTQGQVGGPIAKDKVWFFGSYRYIDTNTDVVGFQDLNGNPIPTTQKEKFSFIKVTAQPWKDHRFTGEYNYENGPTRDNRGAGANITPEVTRTQDGKIKTPNVEWTGTFSQNTFAQVRFAYPDNNFNLRAKNDQSVHVDVNTGIPYISAGIDDLNFRKRRQLNASLSHYHEMQGTHDLKFGFEYENSTDLRDFSVNQGLYYYDLDAHSAPYLVYTIQSPPEQVGLKRESFYAQDTWVVKNRLTVNAGIRYDHNNGFFPAQTAASGEQLQKIDGVLKTSDWSPRIGLSYNIDGQGKSVLRGSYSRFVGASINQYYNSINQNAISGQLHAMCAGPLGFLCGPGDTLYSSAVINAFGASNTTLDQNLGLPKTDEYSIGFEQEVMNNFSMSLNYIEKNEFNLPEDVETGRTFTPRKVVDNGDVLVDDLGKPIEKVPGQILTIYSPKGIGQLYITNPSAAQRHYRGLELVLNKRMSDKWQLLGSFVISRSNGLVSQGFGASSSISALFNDPNTLINADGLLDLNRTYQLKMQGSYQAPHGILASAYYNVTSGAPFNRTVRFSDPAGPITVNAEAPGTRRMSTTTSLDLRAEKEIKLPYGKIAVLLDAFNVFNSDTVTGKRTRTSSAGAFGSPTAFQAPRTLRLAARYIF